MSKFIIKPQNIRKTILKMAYSGSSAHIGCAMSLVEIYSVLYENFINYPEGNLNHPDRDYLILSKGHGVMAQYACMYEQGWLKEDAIVNYFSDGSLLKGLSDSRVEGLEVSSGSLGHGLSVACGISYGLKKNSSSSKVFCILGDGEVNEGVIWEAFLFAAHHRLNNLTIIIDCNGFQALGKTNEILSLGNLKLKLKSFGLNVSTVDGHNKNKIKNSIYKLLKNKKSPNALLARTIKGKGVPFMENNNNWHYMRLNLKTYKKALRFL